MDSIRVSEALDSSSILDGTTTINPLIYSGFLFSPSFQPGNFEANKIRSNKNFYLLCNTKCFLFKTETPMPIRKKEVLLALAYFLLLFFLLPLQIDNTSVKIFIYPLIWFSIVFIVYKKLPKEPYRKIAGAISFLLFIPFSCTHIIGFCTWIRHGTLYVNKKDESLRITMKTYECLMTEGDPELFKERTITNHIKWVTPFEENPIDTTKWKHVSLQDE